MHKNKFGILMKHGLRENLFPMIIANLIMIVAFLILGVIILVGDMSIFNNPWGSILLTGLITIIALSIFGSVGLLLYSIVRTMYQKMFSKEGYLTFTLPISVDQLVISKILVNLIWIASVYISIVIGSTFIVMATTIRGVNIGIDGIVSSIGMYGVEPVVILSNIANSLLEMIMALVLLFCSFAILNNVKKHKVVMAILLYMAMSFGVSFVTDITQTFLAFGFYYNGNAVTFGAGIANGICVFSFSTLLVYIGAIIGFYLLGRHIIKNQLEL